MTDQETYKLVIDWETVKPQIEGAILRLAYGTRQDVTFEQKARECERLVFLSAGFHLRD